MTSWRSCLLLVMTVWWSRCLSESRRCLTPQRRLSRRAAGHTPGPHPPGMPSSRGSGCSGGQPVRDLAHDRNDLLHDITAGAAGSASQQILNRGADLCFGVVLVDKIPIELI